MTAVAHVRPGAAVAPLPKLSPLLDQVLEHHMHNSDPLLLPPAAMQRAAIEAKAAIPLLQRRMAPGSIDLWDAVLRPLIVTCRKPPTEATFELFVEEVDAANQDIPGRLLTPDLARDAVNRFDYWPSAAAVRAWVEPLARRERAMLRSLEAIAAAPPPSAQTREATEAVMDAVKARAAAFRAETRDRERAQRDAERIRPAARYLSPTELRAALARTIEQGGTAGQLAQLQLDTLEKNP